MTEKDVVVLSALAGFAWWTYIFLPWSSISIAETRPPPSCAGDMDGS
jgi:hypothetical protein